MTTEPPSLHLVAAELKSLLNDLDAPNTRFPKALALIDALSDGANNTLPNLALLIDGENISPKLASDVITQSNTFGRIHTAIVYGRNSGWTPSILQQHNLQKPADIPGNGKNAADIHLSVEAKDLLAKPCIDGLVIASSDGDFTIIARHTRRAGKSIYGIGSSNASQALRAHYDSFRAVPVSSPNPNNLSETDRLNAIIKIINNHADPDGFCRISVAHNAAVKQKAQTGNDAKTFRQYLEKHPEHFHLTTFNGHPLVTVKTITPLNKTSNAPPFWYATITHCIKNCRKENNQAPLDDVANLFRTQGGGKDFLRKPYTLKTLLEGHPNHFRINGDNVSLPNDASSAKTSAPKTTDSTAKLHDAILKTVRANLKDGWTNVDKVNSLLTKSHPDYLRKLSRKNFREFLKSNPETYELHPSKRHCVRPRSSG